MGKYYHFTKYEYLGQISEEGLVPQVGDISQSVEDSKKAVFVSKGEKSTILMYFGLRRFYYSKKGGVREESYDLAVQSIKYYDRMIEKREKLSKKIGFLKRSIAKLEENRKDAISAKRIIENMDKFSSFEEYYGQGVYLSIDNVTDAKYNNLGFHNCWVERTIEPQDISVVLLRDKQTGELVDDKQRVIHYLMAKTPLSDLCNEYRSTVGIDDDRYELYNVFKSYDKYYSDNEEEFKMLLDTYDLIEMPIKEYVGMKTDRKKESI